jgi:hypothetical protein
MEIFQGGKKTEKREIKNQIRLGDIMLCIINLLKL